MCLLIMRKIKLFSANFCLHMWQYDLLEQKEGKRMGHKFLQVTKFMSIYCSVEVTSRYCIQKYLESECKGLDSPGRSHSCFTIEV